MYNGSSTEVSTECMDNGTCELPICDARAGANSPDPIVIGDRLHRRTRGMCFTAYYDDEEVCTEQLNSMLSDSVYYIYGFEVCPTTRRKHLQGYAYYRNARSYRSIRARLSPHHVECAKGTPAQNIAYCSKEGRFIENGVRPMSGEEKGLSEKARWSLARECIMSGNMEDIPDDIFIRHYGAIRSIMKDNMLPSIDAEDVTGVWIHGPAGCGKSRYAREAYPGSYLKPVNKWWDGYKNEPYVIIDDWDPSHSKYLTYHLKMWSDRYAITAEIKGGAINIRPKKIIVTSQYSIDQCFEDCASREAIKRRFVIVPPIYFNC